MRVTFMGESGRGVAGGAKPFMGARMLLCHSLLTVLLIAVTASPFNNTRPGCPATCGDVSIPYPFGIGPDCSLPGFNLSCNDNASGVKKPFIYNVELINISLLPAQARVYNYISWQCYNHTSNDMSYSTWRLNFTAYPYRFSDADNKFTVVGCHTLAYITGQNQKDSYAGGCVTVCGSSESLTNGSCSGIGCCQTSIPKGINYYKVSFNRNFNNSRVWKFNPCSYAVLAEADWFKFSTTYIKTRQLNETNGGRAPIVLDWAIGNETCEVAKRNTTSYACLSEHSDCFNSSNGPGYICNCSRGYQGNAYLPNGCQDIDECTLKDEYPCHGTCTNIPGDYNCTCPPGTNGDAKKGTCQGSRSNPFSSVKLVIGIVTSTSFALLLLLCIVLSLVREKRKLMRIKEEYFRRHGGRLLLEEIKSKQGLAFKVYTKGELEQATNNFDKNRILGGGGHGTVYKGILNDNHAVAIKKSKIIDDYQKKEFGKEMVILSQINHKNVVKLLGCCLEVEVPMLVYEFVSNGTLFQYIHDRNRTSHISLDTRLEIASQSAEALAYLHSSASPPIIHGDVKSSNILLDDNHNAKVSDFGASMLVPKDETQFATLVQGTCGYLDPEYLQTCQLTDKSDVYSFGVVLLELLTGKKAFYFEGSDEERSLSSSFLSAMKEERLLQLLDNHIKNEEDMELVQEIAELARRCLNVMGEDRPTMKEVADDLDRLRKFKQHPFLQHNTEEIENLLGEPSSYTENEISGCYSIEKKAAMDIEYGR
ncbi:putative wall-associated receptor kinase-like 16 [Phoenix dactylifera]|uniref:Wall-associated receptor kinase-like 16 n=1 Tax=Phoenix dactylifera TaxID=42345 RepID=A0A8B7CMA2_PHODC|nr:putative wall-associated receptor kinase-like 16 [Phoenix dactylifera]